MNISKQPPITGHNGDPANVNHTGVNHTGHSPLKGVTANSKKVIHTVRYVGALLFLFVALSANEQCQKDYFFATQANVDNVATITPTPDGSGTPTPTETPDGSETSTPTPAETGTATPTATPTPTPQATATPTGTVSAATLGFSLLKQLEEASTSEDAQASSVSSLAARQGSNGQATGTQDNWLGRLYGSNPQTDSRAVMLVVDPAVAGQAASSIRQQLVSDLSSLGISFHVAEKTEAVVEEFNRIGNPIVVFEVSSDYSNDCKLVANIKQASKRAVGESKTTETIILAATSDIQAAMYCPAGSFEQVLTAPISRQVIKSEIEKIAQRLDGAQ